jgi:exosortase E/protease (VPEID-CTERM system)
MQVGAAVPLVRCICLSSLLLAEVLFLTFCFDTASFENGSSWLIWLAGKSPILPPLLLATFTASVLIAGTTLLNHIRIHAELMAKPKRIWLSLVLHFGCFILLCWISQKLFEGRADVLNSFFWPAAWILAVFAVAFSWARMLIPGEVYLLLLKKFWKLLIASAGLGLLGWGAGAYTNHLFPYIGYATFWCSGRLLSLLTADTVCNWNTHDLGTSRFSVSVWTPCAGYEGIGLILIFLAAYLWLYRDRLRFPRALLLFPLGVFIVWLMNCVRICVLIMVGTYISEDIAMGGFHSMAGALLFCCVALSLAWAMHHNHWISKRDEPKSSERNVILTLAYLAPFMSILAVAMITGLATAGFDYFYPIRVLAASTILWHYRRHYEGMRFEVSWFAIATGIAVFLVWVALAPILPSGPTRAFVNSLKTLHPLLAVIWLFFRILGASVVIPLAEEIAFRGYLTRRIISADFSKIPIGQFSWLSLILSSMLFGLMHQRWFVGILAGLVYALALYRRRNLADAVTSHATTNFALSVYIISTQQWHLWI